MDLLLQFTHSDPQFGTLNRELIALNGEISKLERLQKVTKVKPNFPTNFRFEYNWQQCTLTFNFDYVQLSENNNKIPL